VIKLERKKGFLLALVLLLLLPWTLSAQVDVPTAIFSKEANIVNSGSIEVGQAITNSFQGSLKWGKVSSVFKSASFTRHMMCKDHDSYYNPIEPTTIFRPSDTKAECLTTVTINNTIEFKWYYRSNSSESWGSCYNWTEHVLTFGEYHYAGYLLIASHWPGVNYPKAYRVDVCLDGSIAFSEFFEITNGGLNSPRMCEDFDVNEHPDNIKSRFTIGLDNRAYHYLRFDKLAYFNEELGACHNFTTVWIEPSGNTYKMHSGSFPDYKDTDAALNFWEYGHILDDYISINSSILVGNWKVEVYLDSYYFNNTWVHYGPIATTSFIVGSEHVADWTFMVYLDADNSLENASVEIFEKMAAVGSTNDVNVVVQFDRTPGWWYWDGKNWVWRDASEYGNWTDCKRFKVTKGLIPTPENATIDLGEVNMGSPETLKNFVNWTICYYPANYNFLVLWGHGAGFVGVCRDDTNTADSLSLPEISQALDGLPIIMDVIYIDACSMAMTEVAYQIKNYANVLIGPEGLGYAPPPYDHYLSSLTGNSSILPIDFAREVVTKYIEWCFSIPVVQIRNATMSATDLTKMTSLMAAIENFALKLKEKETLYHDQISMARNLTERYPGPYDGYSGYYIDLYHFAQLIYQYAIDEELQNTANQVMIALGNVLTIEGDKALPNSHGLSIFFPDVKGKYFDAFGSIYEKTAFSTDAPWDEFVKHHLSGCFLTIQTPYPNIHVNVDEDSYITDADGKIRLFILPDYHTINLTTLVLTEPDSRGVFNRWKDNNRSNPRTLLIYNTLTLEAEYTTQYQLVVSIDPVGLSPMPNASSSGPWYDKGMSVTCTAQEISGYVFDYWTVDGTRSERGVNPITVTMNGPHRATAHYAQIRQWWETLLSPDVLQVVLGFVGIVLSVAFVGTAWVRSRRRIGVTKALLKQIDEAYLRFKMDPRKCEDELCRLRNTILEGWLADGKITQDSHSVLDRRIEEHLKELRKQERHKKVE